MRTIVVKDRQTLFDIAVQAMGDADAAYELARLNDISVTEELESGQQLLMPDEATDESTVGEFKTKKWCPATADQEQDVIPGGIGFMGIEIDFIVS
jgi:hypothetical protein